MKTVFKPMIVGLFLLAAYGNGCRSSAPTNQGQEFELGDQQSGVLQGDDNEFEDDGDSKSGSYSTELAHPKEPSAWHTRRLLLATSQPSPAAISQCVDNIQGLSKNATNLRELGDASVGLRTQITKNKALYHWCFYQMMADLDTKLDQDLSLMNDKADIFLDRMSKLWITATALDDAIGTDIYMNYLRTRYTDISQNVFGRHIEIMDSDSFMMPTKNRGKAASTFEDQ